jgi:uncharacterized protein (DUF58 family)
MRPTRRGYTVVGVVVLAVLLGLGFGARALNAVVVPGLVALAAGAVQLSRADPPAVDRNQPEPGFPGEHRTVELTVESSVPCRVTDRVGGGVSATAPSVETSGTGSYEIELSGRGVGRLGPADVEATDALGLFRRSFTNPLETHVVVYPELRPLSGVVGLETEGAEAERSAFERIREYRPGDPLRDVHWKSSAKRPDRDLVVAEYTGQQSAGVTLAGETRIPGQRAADAMASATASIAATLLDAGVPVGVVVADGAVGEAADERQHRAVLELLARTQGGRLAGLEDRSDVQVVVDASGVSVSLGGQDRPFEELIGEVTA